MKSPAVDFSVLSIPEEPPTVVPVLVTQVLMQREGGSCSDDPLEFDGELCRRDRVTTAVS